MNQKFTCCQQMAFLQNSSSDPNQFASTHQDPANCNIKKQNDCLLANLQDQADQCKAWFISTKSLKKKKKIQICLQNLWRRKKITNMITGCLKKKKNYKYAYRIFEEKKIKKYKYAYRIFEEVIQSFFEVNSKNGLFCIFFDVMIQEGVEIFFCKSIKKLKLIDERL